MLTHQNGCTNNILFTYDSGGKIKILLYRPITTKLGTLIFEFNMNNIVSFSKPAKLKDNKEGHFFH